MERDDSLTINLNIFELQEPLRLPIKREQEEVYRKAATQINGAIKQYRSRFQVTPLEKILSMVTLNFAVKSLTSANDKAIEPFANALQKINDDLQDYLDAELSK